MKFSHHIAVSTAVSGILYLLFKSWGLAVASFVSGVFIDLDHLIDYFIEYGFSLNVKNFFHCVYEEKIQRLFQIFHGWEWIVILLSIAWITDWNQWITGFLIGYVLHMVLDACCNTNWPLSAYSLLWRWERRFVSEMIRPRKSELNQKIHN